MGKITEGLLRSHHCGELREKNIGEEAILCGWVNKNRDLGGLHFVDLRDKYGITQISFEEFPGDLGIMKEVSLESTLKVTGTVRSRPDSAKNKNMLTGDVELLVKDIEILSVSDKDSIPFLPFGSVDANEDLKLKYRYLDLRTAKLQNMLKVRSDVTMKVRSFLHGQDFVEVETPILYKSTPEGARDYVVPSRVHPHHVYALPQSPQTLKQLLMIGGTDKYFQICKCFRDEDLRHDRQPEFSQIDIEVSYAKEAHMKNIATQLAREIFSLPNDFEMPVMPYVEAMRIYGSDKPDTRFGLKHMDVTDIFASSDFKLFKDMASSNGLVKAVFLPTEVGTMARKDIDGLTDVVRPYGGKGVAWFKVTGEGISGGISKFVTDDIKANLEKLSSAESKTTEGIWLFCADATHSKSHACMNAVRLHLGKKFKLHSAGYSFLWVNEFPLLDYDDETKRFYAVHHPFTSPLEEDKEKFFSKDIEEVKSIRAAAYDVVCNGYELGGGSVRIHDQAMQDTMFKHLGMSEEEIDKQFGFFITALKYGTPPHAGIAWGLDRIIMILESTDSIRDVIAFPKTNAATDLMASSPSIPAKDQLDELHFEWNKND